MKGYNGLYKTPKIGFSFIECCGSVYGLLLTPFNDHDMLFVSLFLFIFSYLWSFNDSICHIVWLLWHDAILR